MEMLPGRAIVPATSARRSSRVNHRASSDLVGVHLDVGAGLGVEAEHQAGRQRPRLAAVHDLGPHDHTGLLEDLTSYGGLQRLTRLDEAGQGRVAHPWPGTVAAEQCAVLVVGDKHDDRRVAAREVRQTAFRTLPHMPFLDHDRVLHSWHSAYAVPVGQTDHVHRHTGLAVRQYGAQLRNPAYDSSASVLTSTANTARPSAV